MSTTIFFNDYLVQVGQLLLLVLQHLVGFLQPVPERCDLGIELKKLLVGRDKALEQLVAVVRNIVVADL